MTNYNNRTVVDETTIRPREIVPPGQQLEQSEKQNSNEQNFKNAHDQIRERHSFLHRFRNRKEENIHFNHETPKNGKKPITHEILLQADIDTGVNITQGISQANNSLSKRKGSLRFLEQLKSPWSKAYSMSGWTPVVLTKLLLRNYRKPLIPCFNGIRMPLFVSHFWEM
jgi:hypothetical protein